MDSLRLDLVSPLPPVRSGIADYTADLLGPLADRCDLRLIRLPDQPVAEQIEQAFEIATVSEIGAGGRVPVYQMGNNEHHRDVWDLALQKPGILTLHDLVLHHFLVHRTVHVGDHEGYRQVLRASHGWIGEAVADVLRWPGAHGSAAQFALPAHRTLLEAQRAILVHSAWARRELEEELPNVAVEEVTMGIPLPEQLEEGAGRELRRSLGIGDEVPVLSAVGFQTPMKRTDVAIRAIADPRLRHAHLIVAGEVADAVDLVGEAERCGVTERVHLLGYVPFRMFEEAIAASDVCLNLRYPTAGETSASLLRILAVGRPVVVSDYAQLAELDLEGVGRVPPGEGEAAALVDAVLRLLSDRNRGSELARVARERIATRHRPEDAAEALVAACRRHASRKSSPVRTPPPEQVTVPTSLAFRPLGGEISVEGLEEPWPEGTRRRLRIRLVNHGPAKWLAGERPEGGVGIQVEVWANGEDLRRSHGWLGLPLDLEPGEQTSVELELRRPPGFERLTVIPHALGRDRLSRLGGPLWCYEPPSGQEEERR